MRARPNLRRCRKRAPPPTTIRPGTQLQKNDSSRDAKVLSTTNFLDTSKVPLSAGATADTKMEQDNQKLFALYSAVNTLAYIAKMAQRPTATSGQLVGLNTRFQTGLEQIQKYLGSTEFNNFNLQAAKPSDTVTSTAGVAFSDFTYATKQLVTNSTSERSAGEYFGVGQLHHRREERRRHHQCGDRYEPGAGRAEPQ